MAIMHERIKEMRYSRGLTLLQVAEFLNVTEATAQRYETGKGIKTIPYEVIEKYAELFHCNPAHIMGWEMEKKTDEQIEESANRFADLVVGITKEENEEFFSMLEEYLQLPELKKAQVREYVHLQYIHFACDGS